MIGMLAQFILPRYLTTLGIIESGKNDNLFYQTITITCCKSSERHLHPRTKIDWNMHSYILMQEV